VDHWLRPAAATGLFTGIHVDIEPYTTTAWSTDQAGVVSRYLATLTRLRDTLLRYVDDGVRLAGGFTPRDLFPSSWLVRALTHRAVREVDAYRDSLFAFMDVVVGERLDRREGQLKKRRRRERI